MQARFVLGVKSAKEVVSLVIQERVGAFFSGPGQSVSLTLQTGEAALTASERMFHWSVRAAGLTEPLQSV